VFQKYLRFRSTFHNNIISREGERLTNGNSMFAVAITFSSRECAYDMCMFSVALNHI